MKFLVLAALAVLGLARIDERKLETAIHKTIVEAPVKIQKTY